jgi:CBS domain-containing protein/mannitol/fructose-specific phosphotransferase system IIA component (Ntr-type)
VNLADLVLPERSVVPLETTDLPAAAHILLRRLATAGAVENIDKLLERIGENRPEDIVAMGDKAFLLHYRTDAVRDLVVAVGTARVPICRELTSHETRCARIVLMIVSPPRHAARYLQVVSAFARLLSRPEVVDTVLEQPNAETLAALPVFAEYELREQLMVRDIMTESPMTARAESQLREAAADMVGAGVGGLPVVDEGGRVVGMLGERELLRHLLSEHLVDGEARKPQVPGQRTRRAVRDVMTRQVLCVSPEQPLSEVASLMSNKEVDRVPVVHEGRLVGFLTRGDIVRKLLGSY